MKIRCLSNGLYIHGANVGKTPKYHFSGTEFVFLVLTDNPPSPPLTKATTCSRITSCGHHPVAVAVDEWMIMMMVVVVTTMVPIWELSDSRWKMSTRGSRQRMWGSTGATALDDTFRNKHDKYAKHRMYRVFFFLTGPHPKTSKYKKVNLG